MADAPAGPGAPADRAEDVKAALIEGWARYVDFTGGEPPHGTEKQLGALSVFVVSALARSALSGRPPQREEQP